MATRERAFTPPRVRLSSTAAAIGFGVCAAASADDAPQQQSVVIVGQRASLASAQAIKRDALEVVDAVVADDIGKLPDLSVVEALQRVTGVQIARDRGDGAGVTIRGLMQVETLLNGREVFTAGNGRALNLADLPSELLASLRVHKSSSAGNIEGGVGGMIDARTWHPFDLAGRQLVLSARAIHGDLVDKTGGQASVLLSDRWKIDSAGEFGALLSLSVQRRQWREDQKSTGAPVKRSYDPATGAIPASTDATLPTLLAPSSTTESTSLGRRDRSAGSLALQWRPSPEWLLCAEGHAAEFKTRQDTYQINVFTSSAAGSGATLFDGTNNLRSASWANAPLSILSFARDTVDREAQAAFGGEWRRGALVLSADFSRSTGFNNLFFSGPVLSGTAAQFTHDFSGSVPATAISGTDLTNPANLTYTSIAYRVVPFHGDLNALRVDADYALDGGFFQSLQGGLRRAERGANNAQGLLFGDTAVSIAGSTLPATLVPRPADNLLPGSQSLHGYLMGDLALARDPVALRSQFGISAPLPTQGSRVSLWSIAETTDAGYVMGTFKLAGLNGNAGVRVVRTQEAVDGWQSVPGTSNFAPIAIDSSHTDVLPSINLRWQGGMGTVLRAAASKTVTRPDFNQLSPSMTLVRNTATPGAACNANTGSAGNPNLKSIRADNLDLTAERYFSPTQSLAITGFIKKVDGFLATVLSCEEHDGFFYTVSRPQNSDPADIRGVELAYQQFFDFLPGWLSGFGLQANYTYIDSETPNSTFGAKVPLQNLSRNSANLVGIYERGAVSARLAYNWRDRFLSAVTTVAGTPTGIYTRGYGWLDGSLVWRFSNELSFALEGSNLLRTRRSAYYGVPTQPQSAWLNDRQFGVSATARF